MEQLLNLRNLLEHQVEDLYSAEEQIIEALPKMAENARDSRLKKALNEHLNITREQKKRLDKIRQMFGKEKNDEDDNKARSFIERVFGGGTKCKGMEGLITEGEKMMKEDMDPQVKDAAIIAAAQKVEHYEISGYGTARAYASQLNMGEVERLLQTTLNEEYKADDLLTALALGSVNIEAQGKNDARRNNTNRGQENRAGTQAKSNGKSNAPVKKAAAKKTAKKSAPKKSAPKKKALRRR